MSNATAAPIIPATAAKGFHGWKAEQYIPLDGNRVLRVYTLKSSSGKLVTMATAGAVSHDAGFACFSFLMGGDFSERILATDTRATEKAINAQHAAALAPEAIGPVLARCAAHYAPKAEG